jgi:hypothetical protein
MTTGSDANVQCRIIFGRNTWRAAGSGPAWSSPSRVTSNVRTVKAGRTSAPSRVRHGVSSWRHGRASIHCACRYTTPQHTDRRTRRRVGVQPVRVAVIFYSYNMYCPICGSFCIKWFYSYSLRPILLFVNMNVFTTKMCLNTSILAKSIIGRREYNIFYSYNMILRGIIGQRSQPYSTPLMPDKEWENDAGRHCRVFISLSWWANTLR